MPEGIDIYSSYQTVKDWGKVRAADITWCYQKVSDGLTTRTPQSVAEGKKAGVLQGGYHFSQPGSPVDQANLLLSQCNKYGLFDLNPCLDLEDNPPSSNKPNIPDSQKADWAVAFGRRIFESGNGFTVYANNSDWQLVQTKLIAALPNTFRWVARYGAAPTVTYHAWQYTSSGSCPGIVSDGLDRNKGSIPLNKGKVDMPLTPEDLNAIHKKIWYDWIWSQNNGATGQNASFVLGMLNDAVKGLTSSVVNLKELIIADDANDVTAESLATALTPVIEGKLVPSVLDSVNAALEHLEVKVDNKALTEYLISDLRSRLEM